MGYDKLSIGSNPPDEVNILIEIPRGVSVKYEFDKASEYLMVDRLSASPVMAYPGNYGFIPHTLGEDTDPLDIVTWDTPPLEPKAVMAVRPIAVLIMEDDKGIDHKILAVPTHNVDPDFDHIRDLNDIPQKGRDAFEYFFTHYKDLAKSQGKWSRTNGWGDAAMARQIIQEAIDRERNRTTAPPPPGI